jgi:adenylate kinase
LTDKAAVQRLSGRRVCPKGHIYHLRHDPPKKRRGHCDHDGLRLRQRDDDTPRAIRKRLKIYHKETEKVLHWYRERVLMVSVDAHPSIKVVNRDLMRKLKKISWLSLQPQKN